MSQTEINPTALANAAPHPATMPLSVLETLAARVRPMGLCLLFVRPDGSLAYHDSVAAGSFFSQYAVPRIQALLAEQQLLPAAVTEMNAASSPVVWTLQPGVMAAALPHIERRQITGILLLVGKDQDINSAEQLSGACAAMGIDVPSLKQHADELPGYSAEAMNRQAQSLLTMVRDQSRLVNLEQELTHLSGQLANTYEELSLIYQISGGMRVNRRPSVFFKQACLDAIEVMGVRGLGVALHHCDELGQEPVLYGSMSVPQGKVDRLAAEILTWMRQRKAPLLINGLSKDKTFAWLSEFAGRLLAVPLQRGEEILGCLYAFDKEGAEFDSVDSKLLSSIANESAIYLENAVLFEDVHGLMMGLLHSLTSAVDAKDTYTCGHSERVAMVSKMLAQEAALDEHQVERIYMAGLLHDVGKIGVPEAILQKPGRLTVEEFDQMKRHPAIGAHILQDVKQIKDIIPGVLHHHERFDGKGYPNGLSGHDIPLMGRIICLADCFDAMTSTRTYRKALPLEVALADIRRCSGTQFDPALTESFLNIGTEQLRQVLRHQESSARLHLSTTKSVRTAPILNEKAA